jgi:hypothetical protein
MAMELVKETQSWENAGIGPRSVSGGDKSVYAPASEIAEARERVLS